MNRAAAALELSDGERETLRRLAKSRTAPARLVQRAQVLLWASEGMANARIAEKAGVMPDTVRNWRARYAADGLAQFAAVQPGRGRKPSIPPENVATIVEATLHAKPNGATHWSCRSMAKAYGVSPATVQRIWSARGLKPHLAKTFKLSHDPAFEDKLIDVVGLYLNPPDKAVVLCVDEKSQIQALDRSQPSQPAGLATAARPAAASRPEILADRAARQSPRPSSLPRSSGPAHPRQPTQHARGWT